MIATVDVNEKQLAEAMRITGAKSTREEVALGPQELTPTNEAIRQEAGVRA